MIRKKRSHRLRNSSSSLGPSKSSTLKSHRPSQLLKNERKVAKALAECLVSGDQEAFLEILTAYLSVVNKLRLEKKHAISRRTVYNLLKPNANPTIDTIFKILKKTG